ncbi:type II toxin-antitoxin system HicB family antitoxin [Bizionia argentinensis JUB59]|uniref:Type II toxin-antitoxin system HicB family antitoxin n=1 Tax=Bizionia argentinensis JUB59 TaxID=1046627 RepID=G2E9J4_9FLAO|nr:type II toxin-antitoxin system HicB family antitoxin [Bizionia argentinensis]EGV44980.1 type II toxin-antitoxin system HicB family antitoxin [Bizionia argentinensis JUB59]
MSDYLTYKGYFGTVNFNSDDDVFYGKIFGISDLINFEGSSVKELKESFEESLDDYLETCKALNKEPNKTFKGSFNVRVSMELHKRAAMIANQKSISLNDFVKKAIDYAVSHDKDMDENTTMKTQKM